jgi:RNA methyltransferase, TrmH family
MPSLEAYHSGLDYSYAPGVFPSLECLKFRPDVARRLLVSSQSGKNEGVHALKSLCESLRIRVEEADRALNRISGKENCYAAVVFEKFQGILSMDGPHVVLDHPSDAGNLGTILRTALGFQIVNIAIIRPAADVFDPKVIRASMGAVFSLQVRQFDSFSAYREANPKHALYPFMLDGSCTLSAAVKSTKIPFALVFGNEGSGLDPSFAKLGQAVRIPHSNKIDSLNLSVAAAIGMHAFMNWEE